MGSNSLTPRPFNVMDAKRAREEEARRREQVTSARNTERTTVGSGGRLDIDGGDLTVQNGGNAVVKDGGRVLVEGGGSMDITDNGEVSVTGEGIDGFTNKPIVSRMKFGNREAVHSWTGLSFMQPGVYLEGETPGDILDTPRLTGVINKDGLITRSGRRQAEGRPANIKEQSSSLCTPWTATIGTIRYDSLINWDGEDGLAGRELGSSFSTSPSVASGLVEDVLNQRSYLLSLSADPLMGGFGKTGAVLAIKSWHMSPSTGWIRVDDGGLIDIQATVGAKSVGVTSEVPGKLELTATDGVNVQGSFTVNGAPVGGAVKSVNEKTGDVVLGKADVGLGSVDNTSDAAKPVSTATQSALNGKASTAVATSLAAGLMPSTDKAKLDGSTPSPTALRLVQRDPLGRAQFTDPAAAADAATKSYVDTALTATKTRLGHYTSTGSKGNAVVANQAIAALTYVDSESTYNVATPGAGRLTIIETGIYSVVCTIRLFEEAALINPKPMNGRSFIDITDTAGAALSRTAISIAEDQATGNHAGVLLTAGQDVQFWLYQTSGGTAYYRARIWLTKNP